MRAVDTNVLIRILVDDPKQKEQVRVAHQFAKKAGNVFVPQIVQVELVWVLETAYSLDKQEIVRILTHLEENEAFSLQYESQFFAALHYYQSFNADFSDCLILAECNEMKYTLFTFDKKFSKLPDVKYLPET